MSKKLSCHSNKTVLLEDPNAATARQLRRMYNHRQQSIVQAIRSKLHQYEAAISGRSKPPLTSFRKGCRTSMSDQSKSLEFSCRGIPYEHPRSKPIKQRKDISSSLKLQRSKPKGSKRKNSREPYPLWSGTFPVSPISDLTFFTEDADRRTPDTKLPWRPQEHLETEDDELVGLVRSYNGKIRQPSRLDHYKKDESIEDKVVKIQRFWRAYQTRKLISVYLSLMQNHSQTTAEATSMTTSYDANGQLEEEMPTDLEQGRFQFGRVVPEENPEQGVPVVVEEPTQPIPQVVEVIPTISETEPEGIVFIDDDASMSNRSTRLMVQLDFGEETESRTPRQEKQSNPTKANSGFQQSTTQEDVVVPGFLPEQKTPRKDEPDIMPGVPVLRQPAELEVAALHPFSELRVSQLSHLIKLYNGMLSTKYKEEIDFLDDQLDTGIIDSKEYDTEVATTQRWRKLKQDQLAKYTSNYNQLAEDTTMLLGQLSLMKNLKRKRRKEKYLTNCLSDEVLPLAPPALRRFERIISRTMSLQKNPFPKRQIQPQFLTTPHRKLPKFVEEEQQVDEQKIEAQCQVLTRNLIVQALQQCLKSSYIKAKLRKLSGRSNDAKGIRTDEVIVESFVKKLIEYMLSQPIYIKHFSRLKVPAGVTLTDILKTYRNYGKLAAQPLEHIMPRDALVTMNKLILGGIRLEKQFDDQELQTQRVGFVKQLIEIHNTAMFDALNDELGRQRAARTTGQLFLSRRPRLRKPQFSVSNSITRAQQALMDNHRLCCGVHPQKLFKTHVFNEAFLESIRFERFEKNWRQENTRNLIDESLDCENQEICYRLQLADLVTTSIFGEFLSQLHTLL